MKTSKLLFVLCAIFALVSCGDSKDEPQLEKGDAHVYKVVVETAGSKDSQGLVILHNMDNISFFDETANKDLQSNQIQDQFVGKKVYHTTGKVKYFIATASSLGDNPGDSLTMTIYADGKEVYKQTSSVTEISGGNTLTYSTYKFE